MCVFDRLYLLLFDDLVFAFDLMTFAMLASE